MLPGEIHGREYYFVSRERMEADIDVSPLTMGLTRQAGRMVEYGEYQQAIYGTRCVLRTPR